MRDEERHSLDECLEMKIPVSVRRTAGPGQPWELVFFGIKDVGAVAKAADGTKLGTIIGCVGGGLEVRIERTEKAPSETWYLGPDALWNAVVAAISERDSGGKSDG